MLVVGFSNIYRTALSNIRIVNYWTSTSLKDNLTGAMEAMQLCVSLTRHII